jgi:hypothetical protein
MLALLLSGVSFAQTLTVRGCVTDEQNEPLVGAAVQTSDKSAGAITDANGNYVLSGVRAGSTLVFSYIGYKQKEVVATSATLNVVLELDSETLEEMVVYRALYGEHGLWVRPAKMFFETIERDGKRMKRFELLEETNAGEMQ